MKLYRLFTTSLFAVTLMAGALQASADQERKFGFFGQVDAFDRSNGTVIVEDLLFRINEQTQVHKTGGRTGTLSDIRPGTKIGFYPNGSPGATIIDQIWVLPSTWNAAPGYADGEDN